MDLLKCVCALLLTSCFSPSLDGRFSCGAGGNCPPGLSCNDHLCSESPLLTTLEMSVAGIDLATRGLSSEDLGQPSTDLAITPHDLASAAHDLASAPPDTASPDLRCPALVCAPGACGDALDGCGSTISCGGCNGTRSCGVGGPNVCGKGSCTARTCQELGAACGLISDGCSKVLYCGDCASGMSCGVSTPNQCS